MTLISGDHLNNFFGGTRSDDTLRGFGGDDVLLGSANYLSFGQKQHSLK